MKHIYSIITLALILIICFITACTPYIITTPLENPLVPPKTCTIGSITDELPMDMDEDKKPTLEEINNFKNLLYNELNSKEIFKMLHHGDNDAHYELTGGVLEFKKGSGWLRFLFGLGIGNARLVVSLELTDKKNNDIVFGGNFTGEVDDWMTSGNQIFRMVARNFAKALENQIKKRNKKKKA